MNRAYRLIWSKRLNALVVASEATKGRGKGGAKSSAVVGVEAQGQSGLAGKISGGLLAITAPVMISGALAVGGAVWTPDAVAETEFVPATGYSESGVSDPNISISVLNNASNTVDAEIGVAIENTTAEASTHAFSDLRVNGSIAVTNDGDMNVSEYGIVITNTSAIIRDVDLPPNSDIEDKASFSISVVNNGTIDVSSSEVEDLGAGIFVGNLSVGFDFSSDGIGEDYNVKVDYSIARVDVDNSGDVNVSVSGDATGIAIEAVTSSVIVNVSDLVMVGSTVQPDDFPGILAEVAVVNSGSVVVSSNQGSAMGISIDGVASVFGSGIAIADPTSQIHSVSASANVSNTGTLDVNGNQSAVGISVNNVNAIVSAEAHFLEGNPSSAPMSGNIAAAVLIENGAPGSINVTSNVGDAIGIRVNGVGATFLTGEDLVSPGIDKIVDIESISAGINISSSADIRANSTSGDAIGISADGVSAAFAVGSGLFGPSFGGEATNISLGTVAASIKIQNSSNITASGGASAFGIRLGGDDIGSELAARFGEDSASAVFSGEESAANVSIGALASSVDVSNSGRMRITAGDAAYGVSVSDLLAEFTVGEDANVVSIDTIAANANVTNSGVLDIEAEGEDAYGIGVEGVRSVFNSGEDFGNVTIGTATDITIGNLTASVTVLNMNTGRLDVTADDGYAYGIRANEISAEFLVGEDATNVSIASVIASANVTNGATLDITADDLEAYGIRVNNVSAVFNVGEDTGIFPVGSATNVSIDTLAASAVVSNTGTMRTIRGYDSAYGIRVDEVEARFIVGEDVTNVTIVSISASASVTNSGTLNVTSDTGALGATDEAAYGVLVNNLTAAFSVGEDATGVNISGSIVAHADVDNSGALTIVSDNRSAYGIKVDEVNGRFNVGEDSGFSPFGRATDVTIGNLTASLNLSNSGAMNVRAEEDAGAAYGIDVDNVEVEFRVGEDVTNVSITSMLALADVTNNATLIIDSNNDEAYGIKVDDVDADFIVGEDSLGIRIGSAANVSIGILAASVDVLNTGNLTVTAGNNAYGIRVENMDAQFSVGEDATDASVTSMVATANVTNSGSLVISSQSENAYGIRVDDIITEFNVGEDATNVTIGSMAASVSVTNNESISLTAFGEDDDAYGIRVEKVNSRFEVGEDATNVSISSIAASVDVTSTGSITVLADGEAHGIYIPEVDGLRAEFSANYATNVLVTSMNATANITNSGEIAVTSSDDLAHGIYVNNIDADFLVGEDATNVTIGSMAAAVDAVNTGNISVSAFSDSSARGIRVFDLDARLEIDGFVDELNVTSVLAIANVRNDGNTVSNSTGGDAYGIHVENIEADLFFGEDATNVTVGSMAAAVGVTNNGTITVTAFGEDDDAYGIRIQQMDATLSVGEDATNVSIASIAARASVSNHGDLIINAQGEDSEAYGILVDDISADYYVGEDASNVSITAMLASATVTNNGNIAVSAASGSAYGIYVVGVEVEPVTNSTAANVSSMLAEVSVVNTGNISAANGAIVVEDVRAWSGSNLPSGFVNATVSVQNSGNITAGPDFWVVSVNDVSADDFANVSVTNTGVISASNLGFSGAGDPSGRAVSVSSVVGEDSASVSLQNSGTIIGRVAFEPVVGEDSAEVSFNNSGTWRVRDDASGKGGNAFSAAAFGDETDVTISNSGLIEIFGDSTFSGMNTFVNAGTIDMTTDVDGEDNVRFSTLSMEFAASDFTAQPGSLLVIDAYFGNNLSAASGGIESDQMRLGEDDVTITGTTNIRVLDSDPTLPGVNVPSTTSVVVASLGDENIDLTRNTGRQSGADPFFKLEDGPINKGLWQYDLFETDNVLFNTTTGLVESETGGSDRVWRFASTPSHHAFELPIMITAAQEAWHRSAQTMTDRFSELRAKRADESAAKSGIWAKLVGGQQQRDLENTYRIPAGHIGSGYPDLRFNTDYDQDIYGLLIGVDGVANFNDSSRLLFGISAGLLQSDVDFETTGTTMRNDIATAGLYASFTSGGFFVNAMVKQDNGDTDYSMTNRKVNPDGGIRYSSAFDTKVFGGAVELGYRFVGESGFFEPSIRWATAKSKVQDRNFLATDVNFEDGKSTRSSISLTSGYTTTWAGSRAEPYLQISLIGESDAKNRVSLVSGGQSAVEVQDDQVDAQGQLALGLRVFGSNDSHGYFRAAYTGNSDTSSYSISGGLKWNWK